jgi:hypothetical protein
MLKKLKQLFCEHVYLSDEILYNETIVQSHSMAGYEYMRTKIQRIVKREKCVKCGKTRIVETEIPLGRLDKYIDYTP